MKHKRRRKTEPHYLLAVPYKRQENKEEEREVNKTPFVTDEEPDLDFMIEGTNSIAEGTGILAMFCPHDEYCPKTDVDANCFYEKFFHCVEARTLERTHPLSQVNKFYLKYKDLILNGKYQFVLD